jgi:hypothetical protein
MEGLSTTRNLKDKDNHIFIWFMKLIFKQ